MTVSYNLDIATTRPWSLFQVLFRWRGSIWKAIYIELSVWLLCYALVSVIYRKALPYEHKRNFEQLADYLDDKMAYIPLNFMLGFFVTVVINRWNVLFTNIGLIDNLALTTALFIRGEDPEARVTRRNVVRYCVLAQVLVLRDISLQVRKRFPTLDTVIAAGFMSEEEKSLFSKVKTGFANYWLPIHWALQTLYEARTQGKIVADVFYHRLTDEIKLFRTSLATAVQYDWVPLPILYPQVVFLAVHTYFFLCLVTRQYILSSEAKNKSEFDLVFPLMTVLEFIFYVGWMKVAQALINPLGEDDDDFECNFLVDRNLSIGLTIVDEELTNMPPSKPDMFFDKKIEQWYSEETTHKAQRKLVGSTAHIKLPVGVEQVTMIPMMIDSHFAATEGDSELATPRSLTNKRVSVVVASDVARGSRPSNSGLIEKTRRHLSKKVKINDNNKPNFEGNVENGIIYQRRAEKEEGFNNSAMIDDELSQSPNRTVQFPHHLDQLVEEDESSTANGAQTEKADNTRTSVDSYFYEPQPSKP